ncbi:MAG: ABC transporter permease [Desulfovibrio sp.]|nr:ABC transporter permease [Desulfovibrio sp.]
MFFEIVRGAVTRQKRKLLVMACAMTLGISLATAMLNVMFDVGDKVNQELRAYGANIVVSPRGASFLGDIYGVEEGVGVADKYLAEAELPRIKTIFWAFNIVDFTPWLDIMVRLDEDSAPVRLAGAWFSKHLDLPTGESVDTGAVNLKSWWDVRGAWLDDSDISGVMVGSALAAKRGIKVGGTLPVRFRDADGAEWVERMTVRAVFHSGDREDEELVATLAAVQKLAGLEGKVRRVEVSALTTPENDLARRAAQNPYTLSRQDWEVWYCTAYVSAIAYQIEEVLTNSRAKPVLQVAESEGIILRKTRLLMLLLTILSLACTALAISNLVTASVMERSAQIGLLKALGATDGQIYLLILAEAFVATALGGVAGYVVGLGFASIIGQAVFGSNVAAKGLVIPLIVVLALLVTIGGSLPAMRMLARLRPAEVLHGR